MSYLFTTIAFKQNKSDPSYFKLHDALPETIRTILTARAHLTCFTRDKVSKRDVCPQGTWETWRRLWHLVKETAACCFIDYYISRYRCAG